MFLLRVYLLVLVIVVVNAFGEGMFNPGAVYAMMPTIDYNAWRAMIPSVNPVPLNALMGMTEISKDPTTIVRKQVEAMLGLKIPENSKPGELGHALALQFMMKAATQIPLEVFDPFAAYKAQAQLASKGLHLVASYTGHTDTIDNIEKRGAEIEKAVKEQVVHVVVAAISQFMTDKVFLEFVEKVLLLVFTNPKAPPAERLNILLLRFIDYKAPAPADQRDNQHKLLNCFCQKLTDVFKNDGDFVAATETIKISGKLQARYGITPATAAETMQKARDLRSKYGAGTPISPTTTHPSSKT